MFWYGQQLYQSKLNNVLITERLTNESLLIKIKSEVNRLKTLLNNKSDPLVAPR